MIKKAKKRSSSSRVEILTFEPGCYFEFIDTPSKVSKHAPAEKTRVLANGK